MKLALPKIICWILATWSCVPALAAGSVAAQSVAISPTGASQARLLNLPDGDRPVEVRAAFHLMAIHRIDDDAETFEFTGVLTVGWKDSRQAFDAVAEGVDEKIYNGEFQFTELSPSWYPQVALANATGAAEPLGLLFRLQPDGSCTLTQTFNAVARSRLDLRRYPFDHQRLEAIFTVLGFDDSEVVLMLEKGAVSGDPTRIKVPQWHLTGVDASTRSVATSNGQTDTRSSVLALSLDLQRKSFFMVRLVVLPLILIVVLSWSVFWMDQSSLGDRMAVSFVGILTAVSYQILVSDAMPHISYVTFMNAFLSLSFLIMCVTVIINLLVGACDKRGDSKLGNLIDRRCRWMFPLAYAFSILFAVAVSFRH